MLEALAKQRNPAKQHPRCAVCRDRQAQRAVLREFSAIKAELDRVNAGHTALQIEADFKGDKEAAIGFMQQLFKGSNIRETTLRAVMEDYADFGGLLRDLPNALKKRAARRRSSKRPAEPVEFVTCQVPNLRHPLSRQGAQAPLARAACFRAAAVRTQPAPERRDHHRPAGRRSGQPDHLRRCDQTAARDETARPIHLRYPQRQLSGAG
ncbi:hypothetical protein BANRA_05387 [Escherichia coli]|nr:hypothetical protein BANRA_05387 [Escherichia coli]